MTFTKTTVFTNKFLTEAGSSDILLHDELALTVKMSDKLALSVGSIITDNTKPPAPLKSSTRWRASIWCSVFEIFRGFPGGIMGMLDGILGGVVGAEMATVVNGLIQKHGGVQGIVTQLEQQGLAVRFVHGSEPAPTKPLHRIRSIKPLAPTR